MRLLDELAAEHELIEAVAGSLRTYARRRSRREAAPEDARRFVAFFRLYAGAFHHGREEDVLFPALRERAELPGDRGPIAAILADHGRMAGLLERLSQLADVPPDDDAAATGLLEVALRYSEELWHHIDAENSVLFPEGASRLLRRGVAELETRAPSPGEEAARADGAGLVAAYPPGSERDVFRGDGCIACPSYGRGCRGLELEWWNEWEWEEFEDHLPSG